MGDSRETVGNAGPAFCLNVLSDKVPLDSVILRVGRGGRAALTVYTIIAMSHCATHPLSGYAAHHQQKAGVCGSSGFTWKHIGSSLM